MPSSNWYLGRVEEGVLAWCGVISCRFAGFIFHCRRLLTQHDWRKHELPKKSQSAEGAWSIRKRCWRAASLPRVLSHRPYIYLIFRPWRPAPNHLTHNPMKPRASTCFRKTHESCRCTSARGLLLLSHLTSHCSSKLLPALYGACRTKTGRVNSSQTTTDRENLLWLMLTERTSSG
jgi:hypothetical protein